MAQRIRHLTTNQGIAGLESLQGRNILSHTKLYFITNIYCYYYLPQFVALWLDG